ncbi:predicted protein [Listeria monocytogenes FSL J2-071]|nr:predicted protein [Listeria monocytogenes FSL J2-071]
MGFQLKTCYQYDGNNKKQPEVNFFNFQAVFIIFPGKITVSPSSSRFKMIQKLSQFAQIEILDQTKAWEESRE